MLQRQGGEAALCFMFN